MDEKITKDSINIQKEYNRINACISENSGFAFLRFGTCFLRFDMQPGVSVNEYIFFHKRN